MHVTGHEGQVWTIVFSRDGARILSASEDRTAVIWDAVNGKKIRTLTGHNAAVLSAAFSPDGQRIVTSSSDRTTRLWNAASGAELVQLAGHTGPIASAASSPDGARIVTGSYDQTVRLFDASKTTGDYIALAKVAIPRCLFEDERRTIYIAAVPNRPVWCDKKWPFTSKQAQSAEQ